MGLKLNILTAQSDLLEQAKRCNVGVSGMAEDKGVARSEATHASSLEQPRFVLVCALPSTLLDARFRLSPAPKQPSITMPIAPITGKLRKRFWLDLTVAMGLGVSFGYAFWRALFLSFCVVQRR